MDNPVLAQYYGSYRLQQNLTPRQRRITLRIAAAVLGALATWCALRIVRDGLGAVLSLTPYLLLAVAGSFISEPVGRLMGPMTRIGPHGLTVRTGLTGGLTTTGWEQVVSFGAPQRFEAYPVAVLRTGARVELPGVPPGVLKRLSIELTGLPEGRATPPPSPEGLRTRDDDEWEGPFHRG